MKKSEKKEFSLNIFPEYVLSLISREIKPVYFLSDSRASKDEDGWNAEHEKYIGKIKGNSFFIMRVKKHYRNSGSVTMKGKLEETTYGSRLSVSFPKNWILLIFMSIWFSFLFFIGSSIIIGIVVSMKNDTEIDPSLILALIIVLVFALFGWVFSKSFGYLGATDKEKLLQFISDLISDFTLKDNNSNNKSI